MPEPDADGGSARPVSAPGPARLSPVTAEPLRAPTPSAPPSSRARRWSGDRAAGRGWPRRCAPTGRPCRPTTPPCPPSPGGSGPCWPTRPGGSSTAPARSRPSTGGSAATTHGRGRDLRAAGRRVAATTPTSTSGCPTPCSPRGCGCSRPGASGTRPTWCGHKRRKDGGPDGRGVGFYFRNVTEIVLFGVRGSMRTLPPGRSPGEHDRDPEARAPRKPDEQYGLIEACSPGPYLELFARYPRPDWQVWGRGGGARGDPARAPAPRLLLTTGRRGAGDGIEPAWPAWKAGGSAIELHPRGARTAPDDGRSHRRPRRRPGGARVHYDTAAGPPPRGVA